MDMRIYTLLSYILLTCAHSRGPHHPRGGQVVKRHTHYKPTRETNEKLTDDVELLHDKEHIQEHLGDILPEPDLSKMTDEDLEFYYFHVHDIDKNSKLDGLEILQAIFHIDHHEDESVQSGNEGTGRLSNAILNEFIYYVELIDQVLTEDDIDGDGYLSYPEYVSGRRESRDSKALKFYPVVS